MKKFHKNNRGSILIIALVLFSILLILALTFVGQEVISREEAVRSWTAAAQDDALHVTLQRFADNFNAKPAGSTKIDLPESPKSPSKPQYNLTFRTSPGRNKNFYLGGTWKTGNSIYYPPKKFPGQDFSNVTQGGYYKDVSAEGASQTPVPPWHNFLSMKTSINSRFSAVFAYYFPYGAFAPSGKIKLADAYGCSNDIDDKHKHEDYFSGVPVDTYSKGDLEINEYVYGKALTAAGKITIKSKKGAMVRTSITKDRQKELAGYGFIMQKQAGTAFEAIKNATFDRNSILFGRPVTNVSSFMNTYSNIITLEQAASFPLGTMISFDSIPAEKEMGCYYPFRVHAPFPADKKLNIGADSKTAWQWTKQMYDYCDSAEAAFEYFEVKWKNDDTEDTIADALYKASVALKTTSPKLAAEVASALAEIGESIARGDDPEFSAITMSQILIEAVEDIQAAIALHNVSEYSQAYFNLKHYEYLLRMYYCLDDVKAEPIYRMQDSHYDNTGSCTISVFYQSEKRIPKLLVDMLEKSPATKYEDIGKYLMNNCGVNCRLVHFGWGSFTSNFLKIDSNLFLYEGTIIVPRGRTLKIGRDLAIFGDLWIQDGGSLYVGGNLTLVKPPVKDFANIHEMVRPSGRLFLGNGSTLLVEKDFKCQGSQTFGSVMVTSPVDKVYTISSGIISRTGNITIPYGIMPGISIDQLAEIGSELTEDEAKYLKTYLQIAPKVARISGPFFRRADYIASYAAYFIAERLKDLDNKSIFGFEKIMLVPVNSNFLNVQSMAFQGLTGVFTLNLNAYLGQYFYAHAEWWAFGDGAVPIIPKMDVDKTSAQLSLLKKNLVGAADSVGYCDSEINTAVGQTPGILNATSDALIACVNIYYSFTNYQFGAGTDTDALKYANSCVSQLEKAYSPLETVVGRINLYDHDMELAAKDFYTFCDKSFWWMTNHVPGGSDAQSFQAVPGILVYAGQKLTMGVTDPKVQKITLPASGLLIAYNDIQINGSFRVVGCLVSLQGDIDAEGTHLRFYPYFTKASLYLPKNFNGDANAELTTIGDDNLKSGQNSLNIGITMPRFQAGGWEYYTEDDYRKN